MKYRKRPIVIEAIQYKDGNGHKIRDWSNDKVIESPVLEPTKDNPKGNYLQIKTLEGWMTAQEGDWIIKGVQGEFYPCKPDIFAMIYELNIPKKQQCPSCLGRGFVLHGSGTTSTTDAVCKQCNGSRFI